MVLQQKVTAVAGNRADRVQPPGDGHEMLNRNPEGLRGRLRFSKRTDACASLYMHQVLGHWHWRTTPLPIISSWWCYNVLNLWGTRLDWAKTAVWSVCRWVSWGTAKLEHTMVHAKYYLMSLPVQKLSKFRFRILPPKHDIWKWWSQAETSLLF